MKQQEWTFIDKARWPERGEWDGEPDKVQWIDKATGYPCLALRAHANWCGYVGVVEGHPAFRKEYSDVDKNIIVHGGLTFAGACSTKQVEPRICHIVEEGENDNVWWLGFDCAHCGDKRPATDARILEIEHMYPLAHNEDVYRNLEYVKTECGFLAEQLKAMEGVKNE